MELLKDRNRYRQCNNSYLLEEACCNPNAELALVLGERLEGVLVDEAAAEERLADAREGYSQEINELTEQVYVLERRIQELENELENKEQVA